MTLSKTDFFSKLSKIPTNTDAEKKFRKNLVAAVNDDTRGEFATNQVRVLFLEAIRLNLGATVFLLLRFNQQLANARDEMFNSSALHLAVAKNLPGMVSALLQLEITVVDVLDENKQTPLHLSAAVNATKCTELLLQAGAKVDCRDASGQTALVIAASHNRAEIVQVLLKAKADVNIANDYGSTPLQIAVVNGFTSVVNLLIAGGAEITRAMIKICRKSEIKSILVLERAKRLDEAEKTAAETKRVLEENNVSINESPWCKQFEAVQRKIVGGVGVGVGVSFKVIASGPTRQSAENAAIAVIRGNVAGEKCEDKSEPRVAVVDATNKSKAVKEPTNNMSAAEIERLFQANKISIEQHFGEFQAVQFVSTLYDAVYGPHKHYFAAGKTYEEVVDAALSMIDADANAANVTSKKSEMVTPLTDNDIDAEILQLLRDNNISIVQYSSGVCEAIQEETTSYAHIVKPIARGPTCQGVIDAALKKINADAKKVTAATNNVANYLSKMLDEVNAVEEQSLDREFRKMLDEINATKETRSESAATSSSDTIEQTTKSKTLEQEKLDAKNAVAVELSKKLAAHNLVWHMTPSGQYIVQTRKLKTVGLGKSLETAVQRAFADLGLE